jgi:NAD(P)H-flavin reductase
MQLAERAPDPMTPTSFRVASSTQELEDTWTLELEPLASAGLTPFRPGQFAMLYAFGAGEIPISVSGDLTRTGPLVHTIRAVGAVSRALCALGPADMVGVRGPFGTAWPLEDAQDRDLVLVAGGIGLAPLRPAVYHVLTHRERYGRVVLLYGSRTPADLLYAEELEHWRGRFDLQVEVTVDSAPRDWRGSVGLVTKLMARAEVDGDSAVGMVCGPEVMMRFAVDALSDMGLARDRIHLSMERSMHCAIGLCGHCQLRELFICKDGPVFALPTLEPLLRGREL